MRKVHWTWGILAFLALWHGALRRHAYSLPLTCDEGEYAYQANVWSAGGLPYRDAYSQKPPVVFLAYRAALAVSSDLRAPRALAIAAALAAMLLLFEAALPWGEVPAVAAAGAWAVLSTDPVGDLGFTANTEAFVALFTTAAAWALARSWRRPSQRRWLVAAGLAAGAAVCAKQTAFFPLAVFALLALWKERAWRRFAVFLAAAFVIPAAFAAYFAARGGLRELLDQALLGNMNYASMLSSPSLWRTHGRWLVGRLLPELARGGWPCWMLALGGLADGKIRRGAALEVLSTSWLGAALAAAATGLYFFPHYFLQAYPPLALAAALGVRRLHERSRRAALAATAFLFFYPTLARARIYFFDPPPVVARKLLYPNPLYEARAAADYVAARTRPSDPVYVFGYEPEIYVYAARWAATRYVSTYPLTLFPRSAAPGEEELANLRRILPPYVVYAASPAGNLIGGELGRRFSQGFDALLEENYRLERRFDVNADNGLLVFARAPAKGTRPPR